MVRVLGGVPVPGGASIDGDVPVAAGRQEVGIHLGSGGKGGGRVRGNVGLHSDKVEHGCAVHFYAISSGPV